MGSEMCIRDSVLLDGHAPRNASWRAIRHAGTIFHATLADPSILPTNRTMPWGPLIKQRQEDATAATQSSPAPRLYIEDRDQFESLPTLDWSAISRMVPPIQQGVALLYHSSSLIEGSWGVGLSFGGGAPCGSPPPMESGHSWDDGLSSVEGAPYGSPPTLKIDHSQAHLQHHAPEERLSLIHI